MKKPRKKIRATLPVHLPKRLPKRSPAERIRLAEQFPVIVQPVPMPHHAWTPAREDKDNCRPRVMRRTA